MSTYSIKQIEEKYCIFEDDHILQTPEGNEVNTSYKKVAEKILTDISTYGADFSNQESILDWIHIMRDYFVFYSHEEAEEVVINRFKERDWTFYVENYPSKEWRSLVGKRRNREEAIPKWLAKATHMQMVAAFNFAEYYNSLNLAFSVAIVLEEHSESERGKVLASVAKLIAEYSDYKDVGINQSRLNLFELYYGIHLEENGPILSEVIEAERKSREADFGVGDLPGIVVTTEQLVGRNYYHYTNHVLDEPQPFTLSLEEFCEEEDEATPEKQIPEQYKSWYPNDCWIKRFPPNSEGGAFTCYIVCIEVDGAGKILKTCCYCESSLPGGASNYLMLPGMQIGRTSVYYEHCFYPPAAILNDLQNLVKGRYIPSGFTLIGKRLPKEMLEKEQDYYTLQSPYRLAYMHMSLQFDEEGIIEDFNYSSWHSNGSCWGNMFSRPVEVEERKDESIDMLLYIYDKYADEEIKTIEDK